MDQPQQAQVVVIGGGIIGCSVAYHLASRGWTDVCLLDRKMLTSGTTWHAAGLITQARPTRGMRQIVARSLEVFAELDAAFVAGSGLSPGFRTTGTIHLATSENRWREFQHQATNGRASGQEIDLIDANSAQLLFPPLSTDGVLGALYYPKDARGTATDTTMALAQAARRMGVGIMENTAVLAINESNGLVTSVATANGEIECEYVVNCTGMWGREVASQNDIQAPLQALAHYYVVTEPIPELPAHMPTVKSPDDWGYVKDEAGSMMVGFFEHGSTPWSSRGIPVDTEFPTLAEDWDHLGPFYEGMIRRFPVLENAGIKLCFSGPESFTPDGNFHLGPTPELPNYFLACGFNSIGYLSGPGAGDVIAQWIIDGVCPIDLPEADPSRSTRHQGNRRYLETRVVETLDKAYTIHWPFEQRTSARGIKRSPLHAQVQTAGAVFGEVGGWERANWYATGSLKQEYSYSFERPHWFPAWQHEHLGVRDSVGLFDLSSFGKILVQGQSAADLIDYLSVSTLGKVGSIVYTQWLNDRGGIESDVTITRVADSEFLVLTPTGTVRRDLGRLRQHGRGRPVTATDVSGMYSLIAIMGPRSRDLLQELTDHDLSNDSFKFLDSRHIDIGHTYGRATRISYVGELGWELLVPTEEAVHVYDSIVDTGKKYGLVHAGYHALDSLRLEKGYRSWGHDIGPLDDLFQAGLSFTIDWKKPAGFIGRDAAVAAQGRGKPTRRLVQIAFDDPQVLAFHDEPIYRDGRLVGHIASASYGHSLGRTVALGYISSPEPIAASWINDASYEVEVAMQRTQVTVSTKPLFDPKNERMKK